MRDTGALAAYVSQTGEIHALDRVGYRDVGHEVVHAATHPNLSNNLDDLMRQTSKSSDESLFAHKHASRLVEGMAEFVTRTILEPFTMEGGRSAPGTRRKAYPEEFEAVEELIKSTPATSEMIYRAVLAGEIDPTLQEAIEVRAREGVWPPWRGER